MSPPRAPRMSSGDSKTTAESAVVSPQRPPVDKKDEKLHTRRSIRLQNQSALPVPPKEILQRLAKQDRVPRKLLVFASFGFHIQNQFYQRLGVEFSSGMSSLNASWLDVNVFSQALTSRSPLSTVVGHQIIATDALIFFIDRYSIFYRFDLERQMESILTQDKFQSKTVLILADSAMDFDHYLNDEMVKRLSDIGPKHYIKHFAVSSGTGDGLNDALDWLMNQLLSVPKSTKRFKRLVKERKMREKHLKNDVAPKSSESPFDLNGVLNMLKRGITFGANE